MPRSCVAVGHTMGHGGGGRCILLREVEGMTSRFRQFTDVDGCVPRCCCRCWRCTTCSMASFTRCGPAELCMMGKGPWAVLG